MIWIGDWEIGFRIEGWNFGFEIGFGIWIKIGIQLKIIFELKINLIGCWDNGLVEKIWPT